jgi:hypothetical protein
MKLLTQKQTNRIFDNNSIEFHQYYEDGSTESQMIMTPENFNEAVNALLMDAKIVKSLLKQAKRIKEKNS